MASTKTGKSELGIHLDVGHDSIGWCVTRTFTENEQFLAIPGTGVVLFPADDCLANQRRTFRRQRRHIRATRQRIARMKAILLMLGVMTEQELSRNLTAAPWKLAAEALSCGKLLSWPEMWSVLRWYAHNRGYDGNVLASAKNRQEGDADDIKKNLAAREMMKKYGTETMAETMCRFLGVVPNGEKISSREYFKGNKVSFDRSVVVKEVTRILEAHKGKLKGLTDDFIHTLVADPLTEKNFLRSQPGLPFQIQNRYWGGVLFGQLAPRFDNRIIGHCPISGKKLPSKVSPEFLEFRWAMMLANVRVGVGGRALTPDEIARLNTEVAKVGGFAKGEFKKAVRDATGESLNNVDALLTTPEADASLVRFPGVHALAKRGLREILDDKEFRKFANMLFRGKRLTLAKLAAAVDNEKTRQSILSLADPKRQKGRGKKRSREELLHEGIKADLPTGRAPFAKEVMADASKSVYSGKDPRENGGVIYRDSTKEDVVKEQDIDKETNNHLIRHRVKILLRLLKDIVRDYAENNPAQVGQITIEMARDLKDLSGMTNKQIEADMRDRTRQHVLAAKRIAKHLGIDVRLVSPGLIRKVRIAEDLGWKCPYTGVTYDIQDIVSKSDGEPGCVDKDHILPRSERATDSLDSLALTYREVNEMKGARTGLQFIRDCAGMRVPGRSNLVIQSESAYKSFVDGLKVFGHDDDRKRQKRRKQNLLRLKADDAGMTEGMLTRTSYITTLAIKAMRGYFSGCGRMPEIIAIPGRVTAVLRNKWNIMGILAEIDERVKDDTGRLRLKQEIRGITHMHHAVDAITLGLAATFIPRNGTFWATMCKRRVRDDEKLMLGATGIFRFSAHNEPQLIELPPYLRATIRDALAEQRVVVHQPQEKAGLSVQQNMWRIVKINGDRTIIRQRKHGEKPSESEVATSSLFGLSPNGKVGKLAALKAVLRSNGNYAAVFCNPPRIIRHWYVWGALAGVKRSEIARNGDIIKVDAGRYSGYWRIKSVKDGKAEPKLDLVRPYAIDEEDKRVGKREVSIKTLMKDGVRVIQCRYTGIELCHTT